MNKNIKYSQNFLTSEKVLNQIIKQLNLKETDTVYEIGTGKGHLTTKLAKISKHIQLIVRKIKTEYSCHFNSPRYSTVSIP